MSHHTSSRGYEGAERTPVGATVTRVYFCEPGQYAKAEYDTYPEALDAALARHTEAEATHRTHYATTPDDRYLPLPERFAIDCRWMMTWPADPANGIHSTGIDTVMNRTTYQSLDEGFEHLTLFRAYARPNAS